MGDPAYVRRVLEAVVATQAEVTGRTHPAA